MPVIPATDVCIRSGRLDVADIPNFPLIYRDALAEKDTRLIHDGGLSGSAELMAAARTLTSELPFLGRSSPHHRKYVLLGACDRPLRKGSTSASSLTTAKRWPRTVWCFSEAMHERGPCCSCSWSTGTGFHTALARFLCSRCVMWCKSGGVSWSTCPLLLSTPPARRTRYAMCGTSCDCKPNR